VGVVALRILVAGAGALGSVFGGLLAAAGHQVTLLGRAPHLGAITEHGLALEGIWGARSIKSVTTALSAATLAPSFDAILLTVKSFDTAVMLRSVAGLLSSDGCLVSLQNGLGNVEQAEAAIGASRTIGGRVIFGAEIPRPGVARVTVFAEPVAVGAAVRGTPLAERHAQAWARHLAEAGIPTEYTADLHAHLWTKVAYNAALNPLGALFGLPYGALSADPDARATMDAIIDEVYSVAASRGVRPTVPTAAAYQKVFYERLVPATAHHRSSMLQDIERGRPTEIDAINGRIWAYGREAGVATPVNATMTRLIRWRTRQTGGGRASC
jgi:2-dehydropantoate 2-reductase